MVLTLRHQSIQDQADGLTPQLWWEGSYVLIPRLSVYQARRPELSPVGTL
jgi:hypothetical protein